MRWHFSFWQPLSALIDVSRDDTGLLLDEERLPNVYMKKSTGAPVMKRTINVVLGEGSLGRHMRYDLQGGVKTLLSSTAQVGSATPRVSLLVYFRSGRATVPSRSKDGSLFHAAIADTRARRVGKARHYA